VDGLAVVVASRRGQGEIEGGAVLHRPLRLDAAAVTVDDALHGGQPDPRARELRRAV
jgi:hypothetical protein